jgi:hypothetical protein
LLSIGTAVCVGDVTKWLDLGLPVERLSTERAEIVDRLGTERVEIVDRLSTERTEIVANDVAT